LYKALTSFPTMQISITIIKLSPHLIYFSSSPTGTQSSANSRVSSICGVYWSPKLPGSERHEQICHRRWCCD